jgi:arylsulfatase A-like enzyme
LRGRTCDGLVCLADLLPTLLGLAGAPVPTDTDGIDLLAVERGMARRDHLFGTCGGYLHYVKAGDGKLCRETLDGRELFFDLAADPREECDLAASHPEAPRLRRLLDEHLAALAGHRVDDPGVPTSSVNLPENVHPGMISRQD